MKRGFKAILAIITIISILIVGRCGLIRRDNSQDDNGQTGVVTPEPVDVDVDDNNEQDSNEQNEEPDKPEDEDSPNFWEMFESVVSEKETPYVKIKENGERVYLAETRPEVVMLTQVVAEYGRALNDIDWETTTGWEGQELKTPEAQKRYEEDGINEIALDFYKTYKIKRKFLGVTYNYVELYGKEKYSNCRC